MKKQKPLPTPTEQQFNALNGAYKYFNRKLFNNQLPGYILNFSRLRGTHGFMAPERWKRVGEKEFGTHEISLTPTTLYQMPLKSFPLWCMKWLICGNGNLVILLAMTIITKNGQLK